MADFFREPGSLFSLGGRRQSTCKVQGHSDVYGRVTGLRYSYRLVLLVPYTIPSQFHLQFLSPFSFPFPTHISSSFLFPLSSFPLLFSHDATACLLFSSKRSLNALLIRKSCVRLCAWAAYAPK